MRKIAIKLFRFIDSNLIYFKLLKTLENKLLLYPRYVQN